MNLRGQDRDRPESAGYAMAALLVSLGVMSVLMSVAMPVWRHAAQREKEAELVFRGEQYARAIGLFQRKFAGAFPPNIDVLVEQKMLRKKYKDPMTPDGEFQILYQTGVAAGAPGAGARGAPGSAAPDARSGAGGPGVPQGAQTASQTPPTFVLGSQGTLGPRGGVVGVVSRSKEPSIRLYNGRSRYDEWQFVYTAVSAQPGAPGTPGAAQPGPPLDPSGAPRPPGTVVPVPGSERPPPGIGRPGMAPPGGAPGGGIRPRQ